MVVLELAYPTAYTCLYKVSPGVLSKTLSHMWGKLHLPIFIFNVGLLTLIKIVSINFVSTYQAGRQGISSSNPQVVSANSKEASAVLPRQVVLRQTALIPRQSALNPWALTVFPLRQVVVPKQADS